LDNKIYNNSCLGDVTKIAEMMSNAKEILSWTIKIIIIQVWTMSQKSIKCVLFQVLYNTDNQLDATITVY